MDDAVRVCRETRGPAPASRPRPQLSRRNAVSGVVHSLGGVANPCVAGRLFSSTAVAHGDPLYRGGAFRTREAITRDGPDRRRAGC